MAVANGIIKKVLKEADDPNGRSFVVASYENRDGKLSEIKLGGRIGALTEGDSFFAEGDWKTSSYKGRDQHVFNATAVRPDFPKSEKGILEWLDRAYQGTNTDISSSKLRELTQKHGDETLNHLLSDPSDLVACSKKPDKHAEKIVRILEAKTSAKRAADLMRSANIDTRSINSVLTAFQTDSYQTLEKNPYDIMVVPTIDFGKADQLGSQMGVTSDDSRRIVAAVWDAIAEAEKNGSSSVPADLVVEAIAERVGLSSDVVGAVIKQKISSNDTDKFYALRIPGHDGLFVMSEASYRNEVSAATSILNMLEGGHSNDPEEIERIANEVLEGTVLDEHQRNAVKVGATHPVSIITGGPGTGKSTILEKLLEVSRRVENRDVIVTAPTGKAAKRAEEVTGEPGQTLQMLLGQFRNPRTGLNEFKRNRSNPLPEDTVVVVDEVSMMDNELLSALFAAMPKSGRVILQGDEDQLPSVGVGRVLSDLMQANVEGRSVIPVARLVNVYRQDPKSKISKDAELMSAGKVPELTENPQGGVMFKECDSRDITNNIIKMVRSQFVAKGIDPTKNVAIITPQAPGAGGTWEVNTAMSKELNPNGQSIPGVERGKWDDDRMPIPRVGDRVMLTENDHENEVMNGDIGFITGFKESPKNPRHSLIEVEYDDGRKVEMHSSKWRDLILSYAITCHKSQGSQYPIVLMPFSDMHQRMAERTLVYTGWTRAKKLVVGIGSKDVFESFIKTNEGANRFTVLRSFLEEIATRRKHKPIGQEQDYIPLPKPRRSSLAVRNTLKTPSRPTGPSGPSKPSLKRPSKPTLNGASNPVSSGSTGMVSRKPKLKPAKPSAEGAAAPVSSKPKLRKPTLRKVSKRSENQVEAESVQPAMKP